MPIRKRAKAAAKPRPVSRKPSPKPPPIVVSDMAAARARAGRKKPPNPFRLPQFPPNAMPADKSLHMALDQGMSWGQTNWDVNWGNAETSWAAPFIGGIFEEGLVFPGYANLAGQAQRPEFRKFGEILATEMTRKWIHISSTSNEDGGREQRIGEIMAELERLRARDVFRKCIELDEWFGRSHLYIDTGATENRDELKTSLGDGRNEVSRAKFGKGHLKALRAVEPVWVYPIDYTAIDPLRDDWYQPQTWFVLGKQVHHTRLLKFVGREVPDLLKPAYSFGGLSMTQMARPYVDNWIRTRQSVSDLLHSFTVFVLKTNLGTSLTDAGDQLFRRIAMFNDLRDNRGLMALDKESEDFANVSAPTAGLHELQAQSQEQMASVASIPIVKLLGIQPTGLNASDEGGIRMFYDWILAQQEKRMRAPLTTVMDFVQLHLFGDIDDTIVFEFEPLREMDEQQRADLMQKKAQTDMAYIDGGVLSQYEVRKTLAADPDSRYASIDVEDMPDLRAEEEAGLDPEGAGATKLPKPGGHGGASGEEEDEFPDQVTWEEEAEPGERHLAAVQKNVVGLSPFRERVAARKLGHLLRDRPVYERADARQQAWKDGQGPFHERAAQRSEANRNYLKMRIAARKAGLIADAVFDQALAEDDGAEDDWDPAKHPRGQPGNKGQFAKSPGGGGGAEKKSVPSGPRPGTERERTEIRKAIRAESDKDKKLELKEKLADSYVAALKKAEKNGDYLKARDFRQRLHKLGSSYGEAHTEAASTTEYAAEIKKAAREVGRNRGFKNLDRIRVVDEIWPFELNGRTCFAAGTYNNSTGEIKIYEKTASVATVRGVLAHEVMHDKWNFVERNYSINSQTLNRLAKEEGTVVEESEGPGGVKQFTTRIVRPNPWLRPDGSLSTRVLENKELKKEYEIYQKMHEVFRSKRHQLFSLTDGVSAYSREYWHAYHKGECSFDTAVNETLAEMSYLLDRDGKLPTPYGNRYQAYQELRKTKGISTEIGGKEEKQSHKAWEDLFKAVEKLYDKHWGKHGNFSSLGAP